MATPEPEARDHALEVRVLASAAECVDVVLEEFRAVLLGPGRPLVSFATGSTFHGFLERLSKEMAAGRIQPEQFVATHLDEYLGYPPDRPGSMVSELVRHCPQFAEMMRAGSFLPVPNTGREESIQAHGQRVERAGGVALQLLGLGRNGHVAFNEPGVDPERSFHRTRLAGTTRDDARPRFHPDVPPEEAVTAGLSDILAARRIVLVATGAAKAGAVQAMLRGEETSACPASYLARHSNALVLLDPAAAGK